MDGFQEFHGEVREHGNMCITTSLAVELLEIVENTLSLIDLLSGNVFTIADIGHIDKPQPDMFLHAAKTRYASAEVSRYRKCPSWRGNRQEDGDEMYRVNYDLRKRKLKQADPVVGSFAQIDLSQF
jgi:hypothetical protein